MGMVKVSTLKNVGIDALKEVALFEYTTKSEEKNIIT